MNLRLSPLILAVAISAVWIPTAHAESWIVNRLGSFGCFERSVMSEFSKLSAESGQIQGVTLTTRLAQRDCVTLQLGERLQFIPEPASGFGDFIRLRRGNGQEVYVRTASVVRDPACGSVEVDRM